MSAARDIKRWEHGSTVSLELVGQIFELGVVKAGKRVYGACELQLLRWLRRVGG
jgi:hypothetical protein